jgi:PiT family inorganic phosphate transporter
VFLATSHGLNDAQKTMGVITMALVAYEGNYDAKAEFPVPFWVVMACALAMGAGTAAGGWRIIHTMGSKIFKMDPIHGFNASLGAALVIQGASFLGLPSRRPTASRRRSWAPGPPRRLSAVRWGVTRKILGAWILTIPASGLVAGLTYELLSLCGYR